MIVPKSFNFLQNLPAFTWSNNNIPDTAQLFYDVTTACEISQSSDVFGKVQRKNNCLKKNGQNNRTAV